MAQIIYSILALMLVAVFMLNMQRGKFNSHDSMILNEVSTQVTGVAGDIFDQIGSYPYDPVTVQSSVVTTTNGFATTFGGTDCDPDNNFVACWVMNDLHGETATRDVGGIIYEVDILMEYVVPSNPTQVSTTPTFAKRATLTISSPQVTMGGSEPLTFVLTRTYFYPKVRG